MAVNIGVNIQRSANRIAQAVRESAVGGAYPDLLIDVDDAYFRANGGSKAFSEVVTHSRSGNATMADSDGLIKWAPHNLLTYSEDFSNPAWNKTSGTVSPNTSETTDPSGGNAADKLTSVSGINITESVSGASGEIRTFSCYLKKSGTESTCELYIYRSGVSFVVSFEFNFDSETTSLTQGAGSASIQAVGNGWYLCSVTATLPASATYNHGVYNATEVYAWGAHLYRSDLGGMAPVPAGERSFASASTYVPTTSSARYLPRVGHHVYNGSAWVNEGVLAESEARTNLLTYSEDLSDAAWTKRSGVTIGTPVTRNGISLDLIENDGNGNFRNVTQSVGSVADGAYLTFSCFIEAGTSTETAIRVADVVIGATSNRVTVPITWTSGVPSLQADSTDGLTFVDASLQDWEDGVYRVHLTVLNGTGGALTLYSKYYVQWDDTAAAVNTYAGGFQAEIAPTPSSYIPTAGSTVTRAAETFTIPSANLPWPTPQVIGDELLSNPGGPFVNNSGWTVSGGGSSTVTDNNLVVTGGVSSSALYSGPISFTNGAVYRVEVVVLSHDGNGGSITFSSTPVTTANFGPFTYDAVSERTVVTGFLVGDGTDQYMNLFVSGENATFESLSVREINPLSVSIQMDGRITYADEGVVATSTFYRWRPSDSNYIETRIETDVGSGEVIFVQRASSVSDVVSSSVSYLAPDILVPFNIAARRGSTFINGAVDGVALTANTTPTALPDLSSTDLELGYDYMGTIKTFRIWDKDLGDTGIEEASS